MSNEDNYSYIAVGYVDHVPTVSSFVDLQPKSQKRFFRQTQEIFKQILGVLAPHDDVGNLWTLFIKNCSQKSLANDALDKQSQLILSSLAEAYENADHWTVRRQILSIMAKDFTLTTINRFIPGITEYRFHIARRHADLQGKGASVNIHRAPLVRYSDHQVEHFIEFIVSAHICTDLPFGEKELKLSTGETLLIPLTIRNMAPQRIIDQYYSYCDEYYDSSFTRLGKSTLFSILNHCTASTRRSLQGLDSFAADGSTAFDNLIILVDGLLASGKYACIFDRLGRSVDLAALYARALLSNSLIATNQLTFVDVL